MRRDAPACSCDHCDDPACEAELRAFQQIQSAFRFSRSVAAPLQPLPCERVELIRQGLFFWFERKDS